VQDGGGADGGGCNKTEQNMSVLWWWWRKKEREKYGGVFVGEIFIFVFNLIKNMSLNLVFLIFDFWIRGPEPGPQRHVTRFRHMNCAHIV